MAKKKPTIKDEKKNEPPKAPPITSMEGDQTLKQKKIILAQSEHAPVMIEILKDCRTQLMTVLADTEFKTLVNALTLEIETNLIQQVVVYLEKIRQGELHEPR